MFDLTSFIFNAFVILFFVIAIGNLFGKIEISRFSFGLSGSLFVGLLAGYLLTLFASNIGSDSSYFERAQEVMTGNIIPGTLSSLFLTVFILCSGLLASKDMVYALKKFGKEFLVLSIIIPIAGMLAAYGSSYVMTDVSSYEATGTLNGALTNSSGLGAAAGAANDHAADTAANYDKLAEDEQAVILETINEVNQRHANLQGEEYEEKTLANTDELTDEEIDTYVSEAESGVGIGYSIGYPFGVLAVILAVNFLPTIFGINVDKEIVSYQKEKHRYEKNKGDEENETEPVTFDIIGFAITGLLGYALGSITVPLGSSASFTLGTVGGTMIVALILGSIGNWGPIHFQMDGKVLSSMRQLSMTAFLAITGVNYGYRVVQALTGNGIAIVIISIVVALIAILVGFIVGRYILKINWTVLSGAITGGMTSAPGLGAAIDAVGVDDPATGYAATQPISTVLMVLLSIIMYQLPMPL